MSELIFNKKIIKEAENDFKKINLTKIARENLDQTAQIFAQYLPISEMALKGFILYCMQEYQVKNKIDLSSFYDSTPEEKKKIIGSMAELLQARLTKLLIKPEQKPILDNAFNEVIKFLKTL
ncbi:MAG: hypothetical protein ACFFBP_14660 [Promethearchaeota archaeon]